MSIYTKRRARSEKYQHLILESAFSNDMMEAFSNEESIKDRLNPWEYNEELLDLEEQLKEEFWRLVNTLLTDRQKDVIKLSSDGYTQTECARILGVNQSSIVKSIRGNVSYSKIDPKTKKHSVYGGSLRRLSKLIDKDERILAILKRINEIRESKW